MSSRMIKVNYGDTLKRFSVSIDWDGSPNLRMSGLRAKIFYFFKLAPDADITLTYVDEDNDRVTIDDYADLLEAINQCLNPLRITVFMKSDSALKHNQTGSSTTAATPTTDSALGSSSEAVPVVQQQLLSRFVCDLVSTVASHAPERYCDLISKLSHDASKAIAPPAPLISELVDVLSKLATSHKEPASNHQPSEDLEKSLCAPSNGELVSGSAGMGFTPHFITIAIGEDIATKVMSFSQQGPRAVCILSAVGAVSTVTLRHPSSSGDNCAVSHYLSCGSKVTYSGGTVTYEGGRYEIICLSGSFMLTDNGGSHNRRGGLTISLSSADGSVIGGGVGGMLIAATPVQVVVGSFLHGGSKTKNKGANDESGPDSDILIDDTSATPTSLPPSHTYMHLVP